MEESQLNAAIEATQAGDSRRFQLFCNSSSKLSTTNAAQKLTAKLPDS